MAKKTYDYHVQGLLEAATNVAEQSMKQAAEDVVLLQREAGNEKPGDVAVTANRAWMKWGFTSLHGVTTVIARPTGQIVHFEVMSRFFSQCSQKCPSLAG